MSQTDPSDLKAGAFKAWRFGLWQRILATSDRSKRRRYMAATFALVALFGLADYLTGFELSLLVFYLVPLCVAVAAVGWRFGVLTALLCVATWLTGDFVAGAHFASPFVPVWNALIALGTYLVVVWLLSSVITLHRAMEERVRLRTAALTEEIAERMRLEKAVLEISERVRQAIGHDLHDGLSQHLTGTALVAPGPGVKAVAASAPDDAADVMKIVALIEQGIEQTRSLAKGLLLPEIERDGLANALRDLAMATRVQFRIDCEFSGDSLVDVGESGTATHIYRIAEEATRNAVRHGKPRRVAIGLSSDEGFIILAVRDDGSGLLESERRGKGLGLRIMAHRRPQSSGRCFMLKRQPKGGTSVVCRLPRTLPHP